MLRGLYPRRHRLLERENPRTLFGKPGNITGANLEPQQFKNSRVRLPLQHRRLYDVQGSVGDCGCDVDYRTYCGRVSLSFLQYLT